MTEVVDAALAEHDVVVEVLGQAFPQFHRVLVEVRRLIPQVVGAHDGGVACGVTAAQPALLDHRDVLHAKLFGQVIGRGQTVTATADDDHVVHRLGRWIAPHALPVFVVAERVLEQAEAGITLHKGAPEFCSPHPLGEGLGERVAALSRPSGTLSQRERDQSAINGVVSTQPGRQGRHLRFHIGIAQVVEDVADPTGQLDALRFLETACGDRRRTDTQT